MPGQVRKDDKNTAGKKVVTNVATTVMVNNLPAAMKTSQLEDGAIIIEGSSTVMIENQPAAFKGCKDNKGRAMVDCSDDVIIGE
jgi:uncharacterized Zn-binding protein involved in type VI secretion